MENKAKRSKRAAFLKVLEGDFSKQLSIPTTFTKNFNGEIPQWLIIEIAGTRNCWRVDIEENETGGLDFTDGWDDFVEAHTLEAGNFLVFEYNGQLILEVKIFDKDGSEKKASQTSDSTQCEVEDSERRHKISKTHHAEEAGLDMILADRHDVQEKKQQVVDRIKRRKTAAVSIMDNCAGFTITWRDASNLYYYLTVPRAIVIEKNLSSKDGVMLKDREGKSWPVELTTRPDGRVDMTRGWRDFLSTNEITAGDTLSFKFLSDDLIQVHVESPSQVDHPSESENHCIDDPTGSLNVASEPVEHAASYTARYKAPETLGNAERVYSRRRSSSFSTTWKENSRCSNLHIPMKVAKEQNLKDGQNVVLCDPEGKRWPLYIAVRRSDGRFSISRGWSAFLRRNKVAPGDTLICEFVSAGVIKVNITRASKVQHGAKGASVKQEAVELANCSEIPE